MYVLMRCLLRSTMYSVQTHVSPSPLCRLAVEIVSVLTGTCRRLAIAKPFHVPPGFLCPGTTQSCSPPDPIAQAHIQHPGTQATAGGTCSGQSTIASAPFLHQQHGPGWPVTSSDLGYLERAPLLAPGMPSSQVLSSPPPALVIRVSLCGLQSLLPPPAPAAACSPPILWFICNTHRPFISDTDSTMP